MSRPILVEGLPGAGTTAAALVLLRAPDIEATLAAVAAEGADGAWRAAAAAYVADSPVGARRNGG